jgi:predicted phosphodiesterase
MRQRAREIHVEPFVHLVDVDHERVLVAWGAFYFRWDDRSKRWEIVDDEDLHEAVGRRTCIGAAAEPFGSARVTVTDSAGTTIAEATTSDTTWAWVTGLRPDTEYRYRIEVDGNEWAAGERWDWLPSDLGGYDLMPSRRSYDLRFRTWPAPDTPLETVRFVALGDYGVGIRSDSESSRRQRRIAEALESVVQEQDIRFIVSLGDNIYQGEQGQVDDESGGEDDDWYSSFFAPYRYVISRMPVFPAIGNHDTTDTEGSDDRAQMEDNFHLAQRFRDEQGRGAVDPGLFYRLRSGRDVELVCIDTSLDSDDPDVHRHFQAPEPQQWLHEVFSQPDLRWRIPFSHHPVYCAGPSHHNDADMLRDLVALFDQGGVRLVLAGHEHNFQISETDGRTYVVSGAGGKLREEVPKGFESAYTTAWAAQTHLLLVELEPDEARLTPISGLTSQGRPHPMTALSPHNQIRRPPFRVRGLKGFSDVT